MHAAIERHGNTRTRKTKPSMTKPSAVVESCRERIQVLRERADKRRESGLLEQAAHAATHYDYACTDATCTSTGTSTPAKPPSAAATIAKRMQKIKEMRQRREKEEKEEKARGEDAASSHLLVEGISMPSGDSCTMPPTASSKTLVAEEKEGETEQVAAAASDKLIGGVLKGLDDVTLSPIPLPMAVPIAVEPGRIDKEDLGIGEMSISPSISEGNRERAMQILKDRNNRKVATSVALSGPPTTTEECMYYVEATILGQPWAAQCYEKYFANQSDFKTLLMEYEANGGAPLNSTDLMIFACGYQMKVLGLIRDGIEKLGSKVMSLEDGQNVLADGIVELMEENEDHKKILTKLEPLSSLASIVPSMLKFFAGFDSGSTQPPASVDVPRQYLHRRNSDISTEISSIGSRPANSSRGALADMGNKQKQPVGKSCDNLCKPAAAVSIASSSSRSLGSHSSSSLLSSSSSSSFSRQRQNGKANMSAKERIIARQKLAERGHEARLMRVARKK